MSTKVLNKQEVGHWSNTFNEQFNTFKESLLFMKRLLGVAICNITYLRHMFPEDAYVDKSLEGINLKVLKNSERYPQVNNLINCLKGVFDALEKKYLKSLVFLIHSSDSEIILDSFAFHFSYGKDTEISLYNKKKEEIALLKSAEKTKEATIKMLRRLFVMTSTLQPLPSVFSISMKLYYYDEVTPVDYQPPCFEAADNDAEDFGGQTKLVGIGDVQTLYHSLNLQLTTKKDEYDDDDNDTQDFSSSSKIKNKCDSTLAKNSHIDNKSDDNSMLINGCAESSDNSLIKSDINQYNDEIINLSASRKDVDGGTKDVTNINSICDKTFEKMEIEPEKKIQKKKSQQCSSKANKAKYAERNDKENEESVRGPKEMKLSRWQGVTFAHKNFENTASNDKKRKSRKCL